jgi:hypothetical protein
MPRSKTRKVKKGNRKGNRKGLRKTIRGGFYTDTVMPGHVRRQVNAIEKPASSRNVRSRSNERRSVESLRNKQLIQQRRSRFTIRGKKKSSSAPDEYIQVRSKSSKHLSLPPVVEGPVFDEAPAVERTRSQKIRDMRKGKIAQKLEDTANDILVDLNAFLDIQEAATLHSQAPAVERTRSQKLRDMRKGKIAQELADTANQVLNDLNAFLDIQEAATLPSEKNNSTNSLTMTQLEAYLNQMNQREQQLVNRELALSPEKKVSWVKRFLMKLLSKKNNNLSTKNEIEKILYGGKR